MVVSVKNQNGQKIQPNIPQNKEYGKNDEFFMTSLEQN